MVTDNKNKGIVLNYTNFLDGNPVCYMMNFSDTIAKARFNEGDIYIDVNETGKMYFLCRFGKMLSSMTKDKLESLLNGMFQ